MATPYTLLNKGANIEKCPPKHKAMSKTQTKYNSPILTILRI